MLKHLYRVLKKLSVLKQRLARKISIWLVHTGETYIVIYIVIYYTIVIYTDITLKKGILSVVNYMGSFWLRQ